MTAEAADPRRNDNSAEQLIARFYKHADTAALNKLLRRYDEKLRLIARIHLARYELAKVVDEEEVIAEVFLNIIKHQSDRRPGRWRFDKEKGTFEAWILSLIHFHTLGLFRDRRRQRKREVKLPESDVAGPPAAPVGETDERLLMGCVEKLDEEDRRILMGFAEGQTDCQLAEALFDDASSAGGQRVWRLRQKALQRLRRLVEQQGIGR